MFDNILNISSYFTFKLLVIKLGHQCVPPIYFYLRMGNI